MLVAQMIRLENIKVSFAGQESYHEQCTKTTLKKARFTFSNIIMAKTCEHGERRLCALEAIVLDCFHTIILTQCTINGMQITISQGEHGNM